MLVLKFVFNHKRGIIFCYFRENLWKLQYSLDHTILCFKGEICVLTDLIFIKRNMLSSWKNEFLANHS